MLFSHGYARQIINNRKNAADSLAISMAMRIRRYGAERIPQYGRSRASQLPTPAPGMVQAWVAKKLSNVTF
jgi:hypothetical protein